MLRADGLLPSWEGKQCPRCHRGTLSKAVPEKRGGELPKHRCNAEKCQTYINVHHGHPFFVESQGGATPLATQAALLLLLLNRVPHAAVHRLLHVNHKVIEDMEKRLCQLRQSWVLQQEKLIRFGADQAWADVEADEATFDKKVINKQMQWEQWCGLVQRKTKHIGTPSPASSLSPASSTWSRCNSESRMAAPCEKVAAGPPCGIAH